jgi:hypothetical protein
MKHFLDHLADNPGRAVPIGELGLAKRPEDGAYTYTTNAEDAAVIRSCRTGT